MYNGLNVRFFLLKKSYSFIFKKREKDRDSNVYQLPLKCTPTEDRTHNLGMCPDQESNRQPFALQDDAQPTKPHQ